MDGFIVIDKPAGITSHDVVAKVRRILRQKKAGHTGTLDPFATGVLPVAVGEGTKAIPFLDEGVKEYRATMVLGSATDTQDCTGRVIREGEWRLLTPSRIEEALGAFVGRQSQLPPMFSAVKRDGVPLYRLARKGHEVEREAREIEVYSLFIASLELPAVTFTVSCSRGTYVRTLAHDVGEVLGCGAHLVALSRTRSGPFTLDRALSLDGLTRRFEAGTADEILLSPYDALSHLKAHILNDSGRERVVHGVAPLIGDFVGFDGGGISVGERVRLVWNGRLLAVAEGLTDPWRNDGKNIRLIRVFNQV